LLAVCAAIACALGPAAAQEPSTEQKAPLSAESTPSAGKIPSFADLEAAGAVIGEVRIDNRNIFDLADEKENGILYRAANAIHIRTQGLGRQTQIAVQARRARLGPFSSKRRSGLMRSNRIF